MAMMIDITFIFVGLAIGMFVGHLAGLRALEW